jgi:hypothetical protein
MVVSVVLIVVIFTLTVFCFITIFRSLNHALLGACLSSSASFLPALLSHSDPALLCKTDHV